MKALFLSLILSAAVHAADKPAVLLVLTNHSKLGDTGKLTGFFLSEAAHPYEVFTKNGNPVTLASPDGGFAPVDPKSFDLKDEANAAFWEKYGNGDKDKPGVTETQPLAEIDPAKFGAIFFAGGHGAVWDFPDSQPLQKLTASIYAKGGAVGAVCHGPAALVNVRLPDGSLLISGKKTAVFTNAEEDASELSKVVPFLLQTAFEKAGATVVPAENFTVSAIRDGRLVTGQNPASAKKTAELLLEAMAAD